MVQLLQVALKSDTELEGWTVEGCDLIEEIRRGFLRMLPHEDEEELSR